MKQFIYTFVVLLVICHKVNAQIYYHVNDTIAKEINKTTPKPILNRYLKSINAKNIVFSEELPHYYKIQNKKGKWQLWKLDYGEEKVIHDKAYDEVFLPSVAHSVVGVSIAKHKGKYGFIAFDVWGEKRKPKFEFDSIVFQNKEAIEKVNKQNNNKTEPGNYGLINPIPNPEFIVLKKRGWGKLLLTEDAQLAVAEPFIYSNPKEVPNTKWDTDYQLPYLEDLYQKENVDLAKPVPAEIVYVTGRNKKTKKWGLYGGEGSFKELIKPAYDSIKMHKYPIVYEVWNNNKVGYYNEDFQEVLAPEFEDFNYFHLDYTKGCALYAEGFWQLYECQDGELLVKGKAKTLEELQELWLNR